MLKDIETDNFHLACGSGQGRGTFIIIRKQDDASTLRYVCNEGLEAYKRLAKARRQSPGLFDKFCEREQFTA